MPEGEKSVSLDRLQPAKIPLPEKQPSSNISQPPIVEPLTQADISEERPPTKTRSGLSVKFAPKPEYQYF